MRAIALALGLMVGAGTARAGVSGVSGAVSLGASASVESSGVADAGPVMDQGFGLGIGGAVDETASSSAMIPVGTSAEASAAAIAGLEATAGGFRLTADLSAASGLVAATPDTFGTVRSRAEASATFTATEAVRVSLAGAGIGAFDLFGFSEPLGPLTAWRVLDSEGATVAEASGFDGAIDEGVTLGAGAYTVEVEAAGAFELFGFPDRAYSAGGELDVVLEVAVVPSPGGVLLCGVGLFCGGRRRR